MRVYLILQGIPTHECLWRLRVKGHSSLSGALRRGERKLVALDHQAGYDTGVLRMRLQGNRVWTLDASSGNVQRARPASVGLAGFFVHAVDDLTARAALLEAVAFDTVDDLSAYRAPDPPDAAGMAELARGADWDDCWEETDQWTTT